MNTEAHRQITIIQIYSLYFSLFDFLYEEIEKCIEEKISLLKYSHWKNKIIPSDPSHLDLRFKKFCYHLPKKVREEYFKELLRRKRIAEFATTIQCPTE